MASNYNGVAQFLASLSLMTDSDSPSAQTFRLPLERLLDNTVSLKTQTDTLDRTVRLRLALTMSKVRSGDANNPGLAAISFNKSSSVLLAKAGTTNVKVYSDNGDQDRGALGSITSLVSGVARNGSRIVVVGGGGVRNEFSTTYGTTWTAGGDIGATATNVVFEPVNARFICSKAAGNTISHSTDATAWTSVATSLATDALGGVAVLAGGVAIACGADTLSGPRFSRSTNGGTSWADASGTVLDSATYDDTGWICGRKDESGTVSPFVWHVGRRNSGTTLRVSRSADGNTWETLADIDASGLSSGNLFNTRPRLHICENTGLMVIAAPILGLAVCALYASLDGVTWSSPVTGAAGGSHMYSVAGGRLFMGIATETYASIGLAV